MRFWQTLLAAQKMLGSIKHPVQIGLPSQR